MDKQCSYDPNYPTRRKNLPNGNMDSESPLNKQSLGSTNIAKRSDNLDSLSTYDEAKIVESVTIYPSDDCGNSDNKNESTVSTPRAIPRMNSVSKIPRLLMKIYQEDVNSTPMHQQCDSVWGLISISKLAKLVSEHRIFTRLKNIQQLGALRFKFPYADHSRYEHSIGCASLGRFVALALQKKHIIITSREILCVELAALCHDLGHGPFSHSFDHLLFELKSGHPTTHHEYRSQLLFKYLIEDLKTTHKDVCDLSEKEIRLTQYFIDPEKYKEYIDKDLSLLPKFYIGLEQLVSNTIHKVDVDKMDYLMRDAGRLRFDQTLNPNIDVKGMLKRSAIINGVWMFNIKDQGIVYDLICRRFLFYTNRYLHPEVNAVSCMLTDALKLANSIMQFTSCSTLDTKEDIEFYCSLTDNYMLELILNSEDERINDSKALLNRILTGKDWYKHIGDFVTSISDLDESSYCELPWSVFTDKSTPTNLLPKVRYHQNNIPIDPKNVEFVRRLYIKSPNKSS